MTTPLDAVHAFHLLHLRSSRVMTRSAAALGIGEADLRAMYFVSTSTDATPKRIGEHLGLTTGAVTSLLDRIAVAGYAARAPHAVDRRSVTVALTPEGATAVAEVTALFNEAFAEAVEQEHLDALARSLIALGSYFK